MRHGSVAVRTLALAIVLMAGPGTAGIDEAAQALGLTRLPRDELVRDFRVVTPDGRPVRLAELPGPIVFLNFWATWCEPCREEMPAMERLFHDYRDRGLSMLALSADREGASVVRAFVRKHGLTFPVGLDPEQAVARLYRVFALPSTFIVDRPRGRVLVAHGPRDWDSPGARALFESLLR